MSAALTALLFAAVTPAIAQDYASDAILLAENFADDFADIDLATPISDDAGQRAWHETFTLTPEGDVSYLATPEITLDRSLFSFGEDRAWGFTFDVQDVSGGWVNPEGADSLAAGAFVALTPRFRLGGQLRVSDREDDLLTWDGVDDAPELKLQSAFRF